MFLERKNYVVIGDDCYIFDYDFNKYIAANSLIKSEDVLLEDKLEAICELVFIDKVPEELRLEAVTEFLKTFNNGGGTGKAVFDIDQDKEYIYAGFLQCYGIDLNNAHLSIEEFIALLKGLPDCTKFAEIVRIRTMEIPKPTKYNARERAGIIKAKRAVALKGSDSELITGLRSLGGFMKEWSNNGK